MQERDESFHRPVSPSPQLTQATGKVGSNPRENVAQNASADPRPDDRQKEERNANSVKKASDWSPVTVALAGMSFSAVIIFGILTGVYFLLGEIREDIAENRAAIQKNGEMVQSLASITQGIATSLKFHSENHQHIRSPGDDISATTPPLPEQMRK